MNGTVVCGVDGSAGSHEALMAASQIASLLRARLVVAHVVDNPPDPAVAFGAMYGGGFATPPVTPAMSDEIERAGRHLLERMTADAGLEDADFIVIGSRGRGPFKAAFFGSVSTALIGVARCPVLIVPPGTTAESGRAA